MTQAQLEIWLDSPITKTYLKCLIWSGEQISEVLGKGGFVDPANNDYTSNNIHIALGEKAGLIKAGDPAAILAVHGMLELPKKEDSE